MAVWFCQALIAGLAKVWSLGKNGPPRFADEAEEEAATLSASEASDSLPDTHIFPYIPPEVTVPSRVEPARRSVRACAL